MMGTMENLWDPCVLRGAGGPPSPISDFGVPVGLQIWRLMDHSWGKPLKGAVWASGMSLRLSEDHQLPHLSYELSRLMVDMVGSLQKTENCRSLVSETCAVLGIAMPKG